MSIQFFTHDLPAARAYVANELNRCGNEHEADIIRNDDGFNLDAGAFILNCVTTAVAKLMALWAPVTGAKVSARQFPSADMNSL
jgi:hypothetical protein